MTHFVCPACERDFAYPVSGCTWCGVPLEALEPSQGVVEAVTEVAIASVGHEDVPYWCALVRAEDGSCRVVESDRQLAVGAVLPLGSNANHDLARVGLVGTGIMGCGLAELLLSRGHRVRWRGRSERSLSRATDRLFARLARTMDDDQLVAARELLELSVDYGVLSDCDVVIEAVIEEMRPKQLVLAAAEAAMRPDALLATNTSGLSLDDLASALARPELFGALHFFNPATRMRLVETAVCAKTSAETADRLDRFARSVGKIPVRVSATPAFAVNRALMPLLNEAVRELEEGVASNTAIDEAIRLGLNHPMGPLALADLIGLDVVVDIMDNLAERTGDQTYAPRPLLRAMVERGALGRKSGAGFYDYRP
jgi:3-hydroxybutyryl-CoA dehydrogenase